MTSKQKNQPASSRQPKFKIKIFWKILTWFWLSMVMIITLNLFFGYINSERQRVVDLPPHLHEQLMMITEKIDKLLNFDPQPRRQRRMPRFYFLLLDDNGEDRFKRPVPALISELHQQSINAQRPLLIMHKDESYMGGNRLLVQGKEYRVYSRRVVPLFDRHIVGDFFRNFAQRLLVLTFLVSFPVSLLLSWIVVRPIKRLQKATRELRKNLNNHNEIDSLRQRRDEFGELADDFGQMTRDLASTLDSQKQLMSDVSHELRSPLTRLQIAVGLAEKTSDKTTLSQIDRIKRESQRMNEMLENLLTLSKLEAMEVNAQPEWFDLTDVLKSVVQDGRFEAEQANIQISTELVDTCPFFGNREALISSIENILRNAIRYSGKNAQIDCQLQVEHQAISLIISDTGPGIPEDQIEKIFDAFYRPQLDRARETGGVGLGLSIAKRGVSLNGGRISAENLTPHGLKVSILFPLPASR